LDLSYIYINENWIEACLSEVQLPMLRTLWLGHNQTIDNKVLPILRRKLPKLRSVNVFDTQIKKSLDIVDGWITFY